MNPKETMYHTLKDKMLHDYGFSSFAQNKLGGDYGEIFALGAEIFS